MQRLEKNIHKKGSKKRHKKIQISSSAPLSSGTSANNNVALYSQHKLTGCVFVSGVFSFVVFASVSVFQFDSDDEMRARFFSFSLLSLFEVSSLYIWFRWHRIAEKHDFPLLEDEKSLSCVH